MNSLSNKYYNLIMNESRKRFFYSKKIAFLELRHSINYRAKYQRLSFAS